MGRKKLYTPTNTWQTPIIENDEVTSKYQYKINYGRANVKIHNKVDETPEHTIIFPNSCSFTLLLDLPHNVLNKLDDYRLNYGPLEYEASGSVFKESYILPSRPPWNYIDYIVSSSYDISGSLAFATQSNGDVRIFGDDDNNGIVQEYYCNIQSPFLIDSSGSRINADLEITTKRIKGKDVPIYRYSVDNTWLDNASYPVTIDPSVLLISTAEVITLYYSQQPMIARNIYGDKLLCFGQRTTWRIAVMIGQGDNFAHTSSIHNIVTGTTFLDFQNIMRADDGTLVMVSRTRNVANKIICHRSTDGGYTWGSEINLSNGLGSWGGNGVTLCKADNGELFVQAESGTGTYEIGLWRSQDHGASWSFLSGTTNKTRKWYGSIHYNRKDQKIIVVGCDQATGTVAWLTQWDIAGSSFDFVQTAVPTTGYPAHDRAVCQGSACDNIGNTIFWIRVRRSSDSLYEMWEHKWASGSAVSSATGTVVTVNGSTELYGQLRTDRTGIFHKWVTGGASVAGMGYYYSKGRYADSDSYVEVYPTDAGSDSNQINIFLDNLKDEQIQEFDGVYMQLDGSSNYNVYWVDDQAKKVGHTVMPLFG